MCHGLSRAAGNGCVLTEMTRTLDRPLPREAPGCELAIFLSHPIQHFVPWFRELDERLEGRLFVHYASRHGLEARHDPEFGASFAWDMDLVSGYRHQFWDDSPHRGPGDGFWGIRYPGLASELRREPPRAVLILGWLFAGYWQAARTAAQLRIPYLLRGESNLLNPQGAAKWWLKQQTIGRLCRGAAGCLAIGSRNADLYRAYGVPHDRIWTAPYFVDNDWFSHESVRLHSNRAALREKFGLPADGLVFLFMGKFIQKKHPDHLIAAWKSLPEAQRQRSALLMVGSGDMADSLKNIAGGDPRIVFPGLLNRRELPEAYAVSDVLVLPSDAGETWGLVVNEAMASRLPAIVSDQVGCAPDLVRDGTTGFIFPFADIRELADRLQRFIAAPALVSQLGTTAQSHISMATIRRATDATLDALGALAFTARGPQR
jgi:glycosyltransferase involved in cell wall biosynthesis